MAVPHAAPVEFGPKPLRLSTELLQVLTAGDAVRLSQLLSTAGQTGGHVSITVNATGASPGTLVSPPLTPAGVGPSCLCLLGVTTDGNTALHIVASRGHAELVAIVCEKAPSLVATRNRSLDTPLHCAAKAGHPEVAACLLPKMRAGGEDEAAALRARNCLGATALYEAVRHHRVGLVDLLMAEAPELSAITTEDGCSPLYLAVSMDSLQMVRAILRPSLQGTPSPASYSGPEGRTALHAAAFAFREIAREMAQEILNWEPEGPTLLAKVDSSGRTPLHTAIRYQCLNVIDLFLDVPTSDELARIPDNQGLFPVHIAAIVGNTTIIDKLVKKCPDYYEMVDDQKRNLLHCAVEQNQDGVVRYICQNNTFSGMLNATDCDGNTPLHLAAKNGFPRIVSILLQTMSVKINLTNKDGLTAGDLAYATPSWKYFLSPAAVVSGSVFWSGAGVTLHGAHRLKEHGKEEAYNDGGSMSKTGTIGSVLIATVAFAAAFTAPGGFVADDHPGSGSAVLARRFAFRAFVVSDTMAFLCSAVATCFFILGGTDDVPRRYRRWYNKSASVLLALSALFTVAAFAFGFHLVLGDANRGLIIFVYTLSSAAVVFCFPDIWVPLRIGLVKAIWRRAGWRGLVNIWRCPSSPLRLVQLFTGSFLFEFMTAPLLVVIIVATFVVAIALNIAVPDY